MENAWKIREKLKKKKLSELTPCVNDVNKWNKNGALWACVLILHFFLLFSKHEPTFMEATKAESKMQKSFNPVVSAHSAVEAHHKHS